MKILQKCVKIARVNVNFRVNRTHFHLRAIVPTQRHIQHYNHPHGQYIPQLKGAESIFIHILIDTVQLQEFLVLPAFAI